jgi:hypothetical protein
VHRPDTAPRLTRRQLLVVGGTTAAAFALAAAETRLGAHPSFALPPAPQVPDYVSRPDLRIPPLTVATASTAIAGGLIFMAPYNAPNNVQAGAVIADSDGQLVWEQPLARLETMDFRVQTYKGAPALTWWQGKIELGHGVGSYVIADAGYRPLAYPNAGNGLSGDLHEFRLTDRDTALLTSYVVTHADLREVGGSANGSIQDAIFQEIDVATGRVLLEWHSLDHIPIGESYWPLSDNWDYVHLNSVAVDLDQNLLVSSRNTHTIYKIDRQTGEIIWRMGGQRSNFAIATDAAFAWQHDARRQPDGSITVFDNGDRFSRALALEVDERRRIVTLTHAYTHPDKLFADSQGSVQVLPNGNVFVGWGAQPYVSEFASDGTLVFDARLGAGYISYRAFRSPWAGVGVGAPALATRTTAGRATAYVSWNGDTRVARWTALAGTRPQSLTPIASVERTGFETAIALPAGTTHVRISGSDPTGRYLATSPLSAV